MKITSTVIIKPYNHELVKGEGSLEINLEVHVQKHAHAHACISIIISYELSNIKVLLAYAFIYAKPL